MKLPFALASILLVSFSAQASEIYVSPSGADSADGSKAHPVATLTAARDLARKSGDASSSIYLNAGTYRLSATFELNEKDTNLTFQPVKGAKVNITGGATIPTSAVKVVKDKSILNRLPEESRGKVLVVDLAPYDIDMSGEYGPRGFRRSYRAADVELFIDGKAMTLSRWPDKGEEAIKIGKVLDKGSRPRSKDYSNRGGTFTFDTDRPTRWTKAKDIWISGLFCFGYADDTVKIKNIDLDKKTITTVQPHIYGFHSGRKWNTWYAINLLEEISQPGEYYVDKEAKKLYFYRPENFKRSSRILVSSLKTPLVAIEGSKNITFTGLTFEATRGMGIYLERGDHNTVKKSTLRNIGIVAVCMGKGIAPYIEGKYSAHGDRQDKSPSKPVSRVIGSWHEYIYENTVFNREAGTNHLIESCRIYNIGAGAIHLDGGDRKSLTPANNIVRNCDIHHFNRLDRTYKGAVNIGGVGNKIQHCHIHQGPALGIYLHGNDHVIEYNEMNNVMEIGDDMGAIYMGRDPSEFGNIIRYNYFHDIGRTKHVHNTYAIHLDDMACGTQIYSNLFVRTGTNAAIQVVGGRYNVIRNNIFLECPKAIRIDAYGRGNGVYRKNGLFHQRTRVQLDITKPPYSTRYPQLANYWNDDPQMPKGPVTNNLLVKTKYLINGSTAMDKKGAWGPFENNWLTDIDPGFTNLKKENYNLKKGAKVFQEIKGFKPLPPMKKMGILPITSH